MARVAFVQNIAFEYLGTEYLSAMLKDRGHVTELFLEGSTKKLIKPLLQFKPDLVCFSCTTGVHNWAQAAAEEIKKHLAALTVFGGPHATFFPEMIEHEAVDVICIGEGEFAIVELADRIEREESIDDIENLWVKSASGRVTKNPMRPMIQELDELPFPDRSIYYDKYPFLNKSSKPFLAARGCPYDCTFCFNHMLKSIYGQGGRFVRFRSPWNLINEIEDVKRRFGLKTVYFQDDTFILNRKWLLEFLEIYRNRIGLPFVCLIRADLLTDAIAKELRRSNCYSVFFGVETGDETLRMGLLKKNVSDSQIFNAARLLKQYGIIFRTYNILGLPGEKLEQAFKTVEMNIRIKTDYPWCSLYFPYPRTELGEFARNNDMVDKGVDEFNYSFFRRSVMKLEHNNEIVNLQKFFFYAVKFPAAFPLIKKLIKFRPNIIYDLLFLCAYAAGYFKSEKSTLKDLVSTAKHNIKNFFFR